jgi:Skp family chaperone for outer membrane proteins
METMRGRVEALGRSFDQISSKLESERKAHEKALNDLTREQTEKYNSLNKKKIEI